MDLEAELLLLLQPRARTQRRDSRSRRWATLDWFREEDGYAWMDRMEANVCWKWNGVALWSWDIVVGKFDSSFPFAFGQLLLVLWANLYLLNGQRTVLFAEIISWIFVRLPPPLRMPAPLFPNSARANPDDLRPSFFS